MSLLCIYYLEFDLRIHFTKYVAFTFANTLITPLSIVVDVAPADSASIVIALLDINILY